MAPVQGAINLHLILLMSHSKWKVQSTIGRVLGSLLEQNTLQASDATISLSPNYNTKIK